MKVAKQILLILLFTISVLASAQSRVSGPSPSSKNSLELYENAGDSKSSRIMSVNEIVFPLEIIESKAGFHLVTIGTQAYWVRGAHVRIQRESKANCDTVGSQGTVSKTVSMPGVGGNACR